MASAPINLGNWKLTNHRRTDFTSKSFVEHMRTTGPPTEQYVPKNTADLHVPYMWVWNYIRRFISKHIYFWRLVSLNIFEALSQRPPLAHGGVKSIFPWVLMG